MAGEKDTSGMRCEVLLGAHSIAFDFKDRADALAFWGRLDLAVTQNVPLEWKGYTLYPTRDNFIGYRLAGFDIDARQRDEIRRTAGAAANKERLEREQAHQAEHQTRVEAKMATAVARRNGQ